MKSQTRLAASLLAATSIVIAACDGAETVTKGSAGSGNNDTSGFGGLGNTTSGGGTSRGGATNGTNRGGASTGGATTSSTSRGGASSGGTSATGGSSGAGSSAAIVAAKCTTLCNRVVEQGCPGDADGNCAAECDPATLPGCFAEHDAYMTCVLALPSSSWICDEDGYASPPPGSCENEGMAMVTCIVSSSTDL